MVLYRSWKSGPIVFTVPYYNELLAEQGGCLPKDLPAHALWEYYGIAVSALHKEKTQLVYEGEPDPDFNAQQVFTSIANKHGVSPDSMLQFWGAVDAQARMLGGDPTMVPPKYRFNRRTVQ